MDAGPYWLRVIRPQVLLCSVGGFQVALVVTPQCLGEVRLVVNAKPCPAFTTDEPYAVWGVAVWG